MSDRTITLTGFAMRSLRAGHEIVVTDSEKRLVAVCPDGATSEATDEPVVRVTPANLDEIEREPDGLLVFRLPFGTEDSSYLLRMAAS